MGLFAQLVFGEFPHLGEGRIEQFDPAVAAEHRDRFGEIAERLVLHPCQPVEPPRQIEALGDIVEQIGDAAFEVRRGDDADRAAIGQEPGVGLGFDRAIGLVQLGFPGPEVRLLRQLARGAQAVEHAGIVGLAVEEGLIEAPQPPVGFVVEGEPRWASNTATPDDNWSRVRRCASAIRSSAARSAVASLASIAMPALPLPSFSDWTS